MRNPLSLEAFADWLGTMPADQLYEYGDINGCAVCQFFDFLGLHYLAVGGLAWNDAEGQERALPADLDRVANGRYDAHRLRQNHKTFRTFGAALERARALLAERA